MREKSVCPSHPLHSISYDTCTFFVFHYMHLGGCASYRIIYEFDLVMHVHAHNYSVYAQGDLCKIAVESRNYAPSRK